MRLVESACDPPTDSFRVRLVLALLRACGEFFDRGAAKAKLGRFLVLFQRYLFLKPLTPIDLMFEGANACPGFICLDTCVYVAVCLSV